MTVRILSFMRIKLGKMDEIINNLRKLPEVKEIFAITGKYDIAAIIETKTGENLHEFFVNRLDNLEGVLESNSNLILKQFRRNDDEVNDDFKLEFKSDEGS